MKKIASKYLVKTLSWLMKKVDVSRNRFFMRKKLAVFEPKKNKTMVTKEKFGKTKKFQTKTTFLGF